MKKIFVSVSLRTVKKKSNVPEFVYPRFYLKRVKTLWRYARLFRDGSALAKSSRRSLPFYVVKN